MMLPASRSLWKQKEKSSECTPFQLRWQGKSVGNEVWRVFAPLRATERQGTKAQKGTGRTAKDLLSNLFA